MKTVRWTNRSLGSRSRPFLLAGMAVALVMTGVSPAIAAKKTDGGGTPAVRYDVSPPLRDLAPAPAPAPDKKKEKEPKKGLPVPSSSAHDPVIQSTPGTGSAPALGAGFEGIGGGLPGPTTGMYAPPDPNGAVGPTQYVEVVNTDFAVFNKSGNVVYGPFATNTVWSGFGGGCQVNNDGDATIKYDQLAGRWVLQQFSVTSPYPYAECIAVSTTSDATGSWARYEFQGFGNYFPDYPKLSVWPDAYYVTYNLFLNGMSFSGPVVCAYDRAKMLAAQPATAQCKKLSSSYGGLLASDVDGTTSPPGGAPNPVLSFGTNSLLLWRFHVDWTTPTNTTLTGPTTVPVASFSPACSGGGTCIPQAGTSNQLDSLADRLMYRLTYRNFGDHESLVVDHAVVAGSSVGMRWYEIRDPNGTPTVYQQGTYAPDASYRWMGSIAMDKKGDIAMGYSVSSSTLNPGIRYTGRLAGDTPLGAMTLGEGTVVNGTGSQIGGLHRWGDYTSMAIDPTDDCTFWYTNEYLSTSGSFNWHTRVGSFTLPGCATQTAPGQPTLQAAAGNNTVHLSWTAPSNGGSAITNYNVYRGTPTSGSETLLTTVGNVTSYDDNTAANGTPYYYEVSAVNGVGEGPVSNELSATPHAPPDFSISASPSSRSVARGSSTNYTISIGALNGFTGSVALSVSGLPSRSSASFSPNPATAASGSTLTVSTNRKTRTGTYTLTVRGTSGSTQHTASVTLTVT